MSVRAETGGMAPDERGSPAARAIGLVLGPLLFFVLLFAPDLPLDAAQRRVAATTAWTATWWVTVAVPIGAASLLPAALFPLLGVMGAQEVAPAYLRDLVLLFIGAFIIALGLERWGVHRRMALGIISVVGTSPRRLVLGFMGAGAFLSLWINNTATTLLMLPIALAVIQRVDREEGGDQDAPPAHSQFAWCLLLGVAYSSSVGGMGTPVGTAPNQEFLGQFNARFPEGPKISFGEWTLAWMPLVLLFIPLAWFTLTRIVFRVASTSVAGREVIDAERRAMGRLRGPEARMAGVFAVTALLWVTRADLTLGSFRLPGWSRLFYGAAAEDAAWYARHKNDISDATVSTFMAILCFVLPGERGGTVGRRFLMDWRTATKLPWDVILLLGAGFCIAKGFQTSGLDAVLGSAIAPLYEGRSTWFIVAMTALAVSLLTEITSNTATTAVLLPVIAAAGVHAGFDPLIVMLPATIAASAAFMMPVATPPNAVVFASKRVPVPVMFRAGLLLNMLLVLLLTLVFEVWVRRVLDIGSGLPTWAR